MRKSLFTSVILSAFCASCAFAEKGGGYIGIDIGHGNVKFDQSINTSSLNGHIYADNSMANFAIKGGYKTFFGESKRFGMRGYVYLGYGYNSMQNIKYDFGTGGLQMLNGSIFTGTRNTYYNHVIDYGVGGDLLFNFIDVPEHSFGIYGGVALGAETWVANGKEYKPNGGKGESYFGFQTMLNVGVRGVFDQHHGIEFGAKFPLLDTEIFNGNGNSPLLGQAMGQTTNGFPLNGTTTTMKRPYIIHASYVYSF
ncbi:outer membrane protein [Helicobacter himalayensis]|uniref:outer membrane protein n=1 Tax=Helicobacter himalayensis TaxID=1591088 RepID=UPI003D6DF394